MEATIASAQGVRYEGSAAQQAGSVFDPTGKYQIKFQGAFAAVEVGISEKEGCKSEGGVLISMSSNIDFEVRMEGGVGGALCRACCTGESAFFSNYHLKRGQGTRGDILLAPAAPGEIILLHLDGSLEWALQKGAFLASDASIDIGVKVQNMSQGCCGGAGFFILKASGRGRLLIACYGSVARYDLQPGEVRRIDNGYLVAWHSNMDYKIGKASRKLTTSVLSGEGFMTVFTGPGTIYVQTRSLQALANAISPYMTPAVTDTSG